MLPTHLLQEIVVPAHQDFFAAHPMKDIVNSSTALAEKESLKVRTAHSFGFEWLAYPKILEQFESDWKRYFHPFVFEKDLRGTVVADIGCGMGKHGYFACKYGAKYIGVDMSLAVEAVYKNTRSFKPLIVQADIYKLPLAGVLSKNIGLFYSIGVLHHLPDPEAGFQSITKVMPKNAKIFIWVYGKHKNARALWLYNPIRTITTRLPQRFLYGLCFVPAIIVHVINIVQTVLQKSGLQGLARKLPFWYYVQFPFMFKVSDSFDVFGTPKQVYYAAKDIQEWFSRAGMYSFNYEHDIVQGIKAYGTK